MLAHFISRNIRTLGALTIAAAFAAAAGAQTSNPLYGPHGVSPLAVRQGILGSCYFHASLAAVAKADPEALRGAIRGDAQTGYRVHFVSGPDELVYPLDVTYARSHSYDRSEGEWVTILMRGYAQRKLRQGMIEAIEHSTIIPSFIKPLALSALQTSGPLLVAYDRAIRAVVSQDGTLDKATFEEHLNHELSVLGVSAAQAQIVGGLLDHAGFYAELNNTVRENGEVFGAYRGLGQGGIPRSVIDAFLTGTSHAAPVTSPILMEQLRALHTGGKAMVAGSKNAAPFQSTAPDWYIPGHAYTVLDYDPANRTVMLRNPWGARPAPDGVFQLPLSTFLQSYLMFSYSDVPLP